MDTRREVLPRFRRWLVAISLGLSMLGAMPWAVAAADAPPSEGPGATPEPTPVVTPEPTPVVTPEPTPAPTPVPTATPTPRPTATPTPRPTATPTPRPTATPTPRPTATPAPTPRPTAVITRVNLYRASAMVRQYTNYWCVPAATQSMVNLVRNRSNRSYTTQRYYYKRIRSHNRYAYRTLGNDPQGWAWGVRYFSGADYAARAYTSKTSALSYIVGSIARTRDPVGVTVHRGTHAWVVLGYRTSHDPIEPTKKSILGFYVSGPLGTRSDKWPYAYLTLAQFNLHFTRYHEWQRKVPWEGRYIVIAQ